MPRFRGLLRLVGDSPLQVVVDVEGETLELRSAGGSLGTWALADIGIRGEDDGFHLRIEGEEFVLATDDDPGFARHIGLQSASPIMRRRIGAAMHEWS
jgi:hypothetical protein